MKKFLLTAAVLAIGFTGCQSTRMTTVLRYGDKPEFEIRFDPIPQREPRLPELPIQDDYCHHDIGH